MSLHQRISKWDSAKSMCFWAERVFQTVGRNDNIANRLETRKAQTKSREHLRCLYKRQFQGKFKNFHANSHVSYLDLLFQNLRFWIEHLSWTYCNTCKVLKMQSLLPNYFKRPSIKIFQRLHVC